MLAINLKLFNSESTNIKLFNFKRFAFDNIQFGALKFFKKRQKGQKQNKK